MQLYSFIYILSMSAFVLKWQYNRDHKTEEPKIFTIYPLE